MRNARARGLVTHRTLVLGAGRVGVQIVELLQEHPEYGLRPVGFLDHEPLLSADELPAPVLGGADALAATIVDEGIEDVIVAFGGLPGARARRGHPHLRPPGVRDLLRPPPVRAARHRRPAWTPIWGMPLIRHRRAAFRSAAWRVKRLFDVVASAAALLVLAPVLLLAAIAVRLEGGPGLLFRQTRVGLDGRPFQVLKFRSLAAGRRDGVGNDAGTSRTTTASGPVGAFIRQTSIDELPQLWNILRGDMSLVGPRPGATALRRHLRLDAPPLRRSAPRARRA